MCLIGLLLCAAIWFVVLWWKNGGFFAVISLASMLYTCFKMYLAYVLERCCTFFILHTELCARERAVLGFIKNSCCVEGSYRCFMAYLALFGDPVEC